ncbi:MAG: enoyl-CoA hydratase/isomerase family protein [Bacteriovoracaceae bacterium]|nr:enoyl-CoA hydratase/isomerase family protein [Bacteriovoracaceae bacterium]
MFQLFNYTTLSTRLEKSTRTLYITLNRPDRDNALHQEMLFELESLLAWTTSRVEINSIFIDSCTSQFSSGVELQKLPDMTAAQLEKLSARLHKIIFAMMQMPQTVVMDLREGAANWAMEFALGADIRICSVNAELKFDHARLGLVPAAGGMSFLTHLVPSTFARQWLATGNVISNEQRESSGLINQTYDSTDRMDTIHAILRDIATQAPVQRIQTKLGLFEAQRQQIETALSSDLKIAKAARISEDWKNRPEKEADETFMPAKSMSYSVKLSLIKTEPTPEVEH